jgi:hypothetical protein
MHIYGENRTKVFLSLPAPETPMRPLGLTPGYEKSPLPPFSKGGSKDDRFKSPFEKGGFRGICQGGLRQSLGIERLAF